MQKWEYKKISRELDLLKVDTMELAPAAAYFEWQDSADDEKSTDEMRRLRKLGKEGWELVSVFYESSNRKFTYTYYFKRPIE